MKTKILKNIFLSLGAIFALAITAHAQNLYVTVVAPGEILEYTPSCTPPCVPSTYATGLDGPRGLAFDSSGNLFVAESNFAPDGDILKFPTCGATPTFFATGLNRPQFLTFGPPR